MSGTVIHYHCPVRLCNVAELTQEEAIQLQQLCPECGCDLVDGDAGAVTRDSPEEHRQVLEAAEELRRQQQDRLQQEVVDTDDTA